MKATWFENKELITLYTDPAYFGADVPESYMQRPCKPVPVKSLFGYEPESKMDDIHHKNDVLKLALQMRTGEYDGPPIVCRNHPKGLQVLDGHHRMQAARRAGVDSLDAVIVDSEDIQYSDAVKEQRANESYSADEVADQYAQWDHEYPVEYAEFLGKTFGPPDELTKEQAVWHNKDGFKRIVVRDEYILHGSPAPHYDFVYCYIDLEVPEELSDELAECSGSILIDHLKNEVGARCGSLTANATTLNFVLDVVAGRVKPTKDNYEKRILDMKDMFEKGGNYELEWWEDLTGDADPDNPFYAESLYEVSCCGPYVGGLTEASGYIPTAAQANDPRFKTALTVDVRPGEDRRNIEKLGLNLNMDLVNKTKPGRKHKKTLAESLMEKYQAIKEEDLHEVDMGSGALRSWMESPEAQGVRAGFELELIFPDTERDEEESDDELDYDWDRRVGTLDEIIDFYGGEEGEWENHQSETKDDFRVLVLDDFMEYEMEVFQDEWNNEGFEKVRDEMVEKELYTFRDEYIDEIAQDSFEKDYDDLSESEEAYVDQKIMEQFEEEIKNEFDNQGDTYQRVYEDAMEESSSNITWSEFWDHEQIHMMSDLMSKYGTYWPYYFRGMGGSLPVDHWANSIKELTGKPVDISYSYHGQDKEDGHYTIEPDSSLDSDEDEDSGYEVVSPVMPLAEAVDELKKLMLWADENNIYTNNSTGLHMNISVPQGNDIDYTKLVLFSGDKYILEKYNRLNASYAQSALDQMETQAVRMDAERAAQAMQKMKTSLEDTAEEYVRLGTGSAKYTSMHIKDGYIEFRGPGGNYTNQEVDAILDTMLRFARAMTIAADPQANRQEYQKKLYKLLSKGGQPLSTMQGLFADYQAGNINKEVFKKRWAGLVLTKKTNQQILDKLDGMPDDKRTQTAKKIQKNLAGPDKPFRYTLPVTDADGNEEFFRGKISAPSAQMATQVAVDEILNRLKSPALANLNPDFNQLKIEIDL